MMDSSAPWVALAATEELPIVEDPVRTALKDVATVKTIALPYKPLDSTSLSDNRLLSEWHDAVVDLRQPLLRQRLHRYDSLRIF